MPVDDDFRRRVRNIVASSATPEDRLSALGELQAGLNPLRQNSESRLVCESGASLAAKSGRPEIAAQFCLMRAKIELAAASPLVGEMKNITMAIDWFAFGLEAEEKRNEQLESDFRTAWNRTRALIDTGYKLLNKSPLVGAVAYCHRTVGAIYGHRYLQLKLYKHTSRGPLRAKVCNLAVSQWLGIDERLMMSRESRAELRAIKKHCLNTLHEAKRLFASQKAWVFLVETYFDLSLEHHSFNDAIRSKWYLWYGLLLSRLHKLHDPHLGVTFQSLRELPLIGSNRKDDVMTELRPRLGPEDAQG